MFTRPSIEHSLEEDAVQESFSSKLSAEKEK